MRDTQLSRLLQFRRRLPRHIDISIETADISEGVRCSVKHCPAVRALGRAVEKLPVKEVCVGGSQAHIYFYDAGSNQHTTALYNLPPELRAWIVNYDNYDPSRGKDLSTLKPVEPIKARLEFLPFEADKEAT